jgi:rhodanese-related sulfurtransferase/DNA-binding transcriptional ArsR family regulator
MLLKTAARRGSVAPKAQVYEQIARIGKAAASPARLELLDLLAQSPRTVEALATEIRQSVANTSHHLQVLRGARLIEAEKNGVHVTYRLASAQVGAFVLQLRLLAESRLAEIERVLRDYFNDREAMEPVGDDQLLKRVQAGEVTVVDVRPALEFDAGHIPGALSLPLPELKRRLGEIPRRREIVAYCRGPYCVMALQAVDLLRRNGFRARRMEAGVPEWRARGWRVEQGAAR